MAKTLHLIYEKTITLEGNVVPLIRAGKLRCEAYFKVDTSKKHLILGRNLQRSVAFMQRYLLTSATIVQASTESVIEYLRIMLLTVRKLASPTLIQENEVSLFSHILYLFQLMIRAIYANRGDRR